jgi:hypothetical protein
MVLQMAVTIVAVRLHHVVGFAPVQSGVTLLLGALFIVLAATTDPLVSVCAYVALVGLFNATEPLVGEYLHREVESSIRSTAISAVSCVRTGGQAAMRLLLGGAVGVFSPVFALTAFGTYLLLGAVLGGYVLRRGFGRNGTLYPPSQKQIWAARVQCTVTSKSRSAAALDEF